MQVVLVAPAIPPNTGNVARLCAATQTPLHLIRPLGFFLDDRRLRRAGLDYWEHVALTVHDSLEAYWQAHAPARCYFVSTKGSQSYAEVRYQPGDSLIFGNEGHGLPPALFTAYAAQTIRIPMSGPVRSLNLATAVAITLFEALRQQTIASPRQNP